MNAMESLVRYGYLVIFGAVFAEQIGLPFPSDAFLLAGGGLAGSGRLSLVVAIGLAAIASLIGDTVWYWLGRTRGARVMTWLCRMSLEPDSCVRRTPGIFDRWGARALVVAQFVPGLADDRPAARGCRPDAARALRRVERAGGRGLERRLSDARLDLQRGARDGGRVPRRAWQLDLRALGRRDRRLRRLEVREPPAVPEKNQRRADHAGGAQGQARPP